MILLIKRRRNVKELISFITGTKRKYIKKLESESKEYMYMIKIREFNILLIYY